MHRRLEVMKNEYTTSIEESVALKARMALHLQQVGPNTQTRIHQDIEHQKLSIDTNYPPQ